MPKYELIHKAGERVPQEVMWIIDRFFDNSRKERARLEKIGGRVLISIAAPYRKNRNNSIKIDDSFISDLELIKK